jgi:ion channel
MQIVDTKLIHRPVDLEGAPYTLVVSETDDGFRGGWFCESCCIFGYTDMLPESLEDALFEDIISVHRTMVLLLFNFLELVSAFAILYILSAGVTNNGAVLSRPLDAFYFSIVTSTTLGFGDFLPSSDGAKRLVVTQLALSLIFVGFFIAYICGRLGPDNKESAWAIGLLTRALGGSRQTGQLAGGPETRTATNCELL